MYSEESRIEWGSGRIFLDGLFNSEGDMAVELVAIEVALPWANGFLIMARAAFLSWPCLEHGFVGHSPCLVSLQTVSQPSQPFVVHHAINPFWPKLYLRVDFVLCLEHWPMHLL